MGGGHGEMNTWRRRDYQLKVGPIVYIRDFGRDFWYFHPLRQQISKTIVI